MIYICGRCKEKPATVVNKGLHRMEWINVLLCAECYRIIACELEEEVSDGE